MAKRSKKKTSPFSLKDTVQRLKKCERMYDNFEDSLVTLFGHNPFDEDDSVSVALWNAGTHLYSARRVMEGHKPSDFRPDLNRRPKPPLRANFAMWPVLRAALLSEDVHTSIESAERRLEEDVQRAWRVVDEEDGPDRTRKFQNAQTFAFRGDDAGPYLSDAWVEFGRSSFDLWFNRLPDDVLETERSRLVRDFCIDTTRLSEEKSRRLEVMAKATLFFSARRIGGATAMRCAFLLIELLEKA